MKLRYFLYIFTMAAAFVSSTGLALSQTIENIHTVTRPTDGMEFRLFNSPDNLQYIKNFPTEVFKSDTDIVNFENITNFNDESGKKLFFV